MTDAARSTAYLDSQTPLTVADAVAAILMTADGRYVLQQRDDLPFIFFPNHWGFFGGAMEVGEDLRDALKREIREETGLEIDLATASLFTEMTFDFSTLGQPKILRRFFEVPLPAGAEDAIVLGEGQAVGAFEGRAALAELTLTPYDHFALWMHAQQSRLRRPGPIV